MRNLSQNSALVNLNFSNPVVDRRNSPVNKEIKEISAVIMKNLVTALAQ